MNDIVSIGEWWMWLGFVAFVICMLLIDILFLGGNKSHRVSTKEALSWTVVWIALAILFNFLLWFYVGNIYGEQLATTKSIEFFTGYLIEKFLSVENLFVFLMIFKYFSIPPQFQKRVLLYGVLGAIVLRFIMILAGIWLIEKFHWLLYFFGAFLIFTGVKMLIFMNDKPDLSKNPILNFLKNHLRITKEFHEEKFFVRIDKILYVTPLFIALIFIEISDVIFAVDSIPAIFAITEDPFIVVTSNIFAVLGLRALYFLLADIADRFHFIKYGLAIILVFIGVKMLIAEWYKIPIAIMLAVVVTILAVSILVSLRIKPAKS